MTREEAFRIAQDLAGQGYTLLPCDDPRRGLRGIMAFKGIDDGTEDSRIIEWPVHGSELTPDEEMVDAPTLLTFMREGGVAKCDDPRRRIVGFVRYELGTNRSVVRQCSLTQLKEQLSSDQLDELMRVRHALDEGTQRSMIEVQAIQAAAANQQR